MQAGSVLILLQGVRLSLQPVYTSIFILLLRLDRAVIYAAILIGRDGYLLFFSLFYFHAAVDAQNRLLLHRNRSILSLAIVVAEPNSAARAEKLA